MSTRICSTSKGMDTETGGKLAANGIKTRDDLADLAVDELIEMTGMAERAGQGAHHEGARALVRVSSRRPERSRGAA